MYWESVSKLVAVGGILVSLHVGANLSLLPLQSVILAFKSIKKPNFWAKDLGCILHSNAYFS